jgi:sulfonate transport system permease protein
MTAIDSVSPKVARLAGADRTSTARRADFGAGAPDFRRSSPRFVPKPGPAYGWLLGPAVLVLVWSIGSATGMIDRRVLPAPWVAVTTAARLIAEGRLQSNLLTSVERAGAGFALGVLAGLAGALFAGLTRIGGQLFDGIVQIKRAIPIFALLPFLILWFGIGETMKVSVIALGVFVPVYLNTYGGLKNIDLRYVELAETLRVRYRDFLWHVILPAALPNFLLGLRHAAIACWLTLIVVERTNATSGIGYMTDLAVSYAQTDVMLVGLVLYAVLGVSTDGAVRLVQRHLLSWQRTIGR